MWWNLNSCYSKLRWWCFSKILSLSWLKSMRIEKFFGCSPSATTEIRNENIFSVSTHIQWEWARQVFISYSFPFLMKNWTEREKPKSCDDIDIESVSQTKQFNAIKVFVTACSCKNTNPSRSVCSSKWTTDKKEYSKNMKIWHLIVFHFFIQHSKTTEEKKVKLHNDFCHSLCTINFNFSQFIAAVMNAKSCRATKVHEKFSPLKKRACKTFQSINHWLNWLIVMFHKTTATWEDRLSMNYLVEW